MISDDEKQAIHLAINQAFDKWGVQYNQRLLDDIQDDPEAYARAWWEQAFLEKRVLALGSYEYLSEIRNDSKTLQKHMRVLTRAVILSMVNGTFTLPDLDPNPGAEDGYKSYTRRQKQRILKKEYPEAFFDVPSQTPQDGRLSPKSSVFGPQGLPQMDQTDRVIEYMRALYARDHRTDNLIHIFYTSSAHYILPRFLEDLLRFGDLCGDVFSTLGKNDEKTSYIRQFMTQMSPQLFTVHAYVTAMLDLKWFRAVPPKERQRFFQSDLDLAYSKDDAETARRILADNMPRLDAYHKLRIGGTALMRLGKMPESIHTFAQCLCVADDELQRGVAWQNIAAMHRMRRDFDSMHDAATKALGHYMRTLDTYRKCNALQLVGESLWKLGSKKAAMQSFDEAERVGGLLPRDERFKIPMVLGVSAWHLGDRRLSARYLAKALEQVPDNETQKALEINHAITHGFAPRDESVPDPGLVHELERHVRETHNLDF